MKHYELVEDEGHPGVAIIKLRGKLVSAPNPEYLELIKEYQDKSVILDMAEVPWMNTTGLGFITGPYDLLGKEEANLALCNVSGRVERKLSVTKLTGIIRSFDSLEEALGSLD